MENDSREKCFPKTFGDCWTMDTGPLNPEPRGVLKKLYAVSVFPRYGMPVYMRLAQLCAGKAKSGSGFAAAFWTFWQRWFTAANIRKHAFEVSPACSIAPGVVFHHIGVCITGGTVIEEGVHIYRNVTFGTKDGRAPYIAKGAAIASHAVVLGGVRVGEGAIAAPGAVVVKDIPDNEVHGGVPARFIKNADETAPF